MQHIVNLRSGALTNPIIVNTGAGTGIGLASANKMGTAITMTKIHDFNLFVGNINPSTNKRSKLYLKAIEVLPSNQRVNMIIKNGHKIQNMLENNHSNFT